jgi:hypothetical protein
VRIRTVNVETLRGREEEVLDMVKRMGLDPSLLPAGE